MKHRKHLLNFAVLSFLLLSLFFFANSQSFKIFQSEDDKVRSNEEKIREVFDKLSNAIRSQNENAFVGCFANNVALGAEQFSRTELSHLGNIIFTKSKTRLEHKDFVNASPQESWTSAMWDFDILIERIVDEGNQVKVVTRFRFLVSNDNKFYQDTILLERRGTKYSIHSSNILLCKLASIDRAVPESFSLKSYLQKEGNSTPIRQNSMNLLSGGTVTPRQFKMVNSAGILYPKPITSIEGDMDGDGVLSMTDSELLIDGIPFYDPHDFQAAILNDGTIFYVVVDYFTGWVYYTKADFGVTLQKFVPENTALGRFALPNALTCDRFGNIYIADTFNDRIIKLQYSSSSNSVYSWSILYNSGLHKPSDIDLVDGEDFDTPNDDYLFIADTDNNRILVLRSDGVVVKSIYSYLYKPPGTPLTDTVRVYFNRPISVAVWKSEEVRGGWLYYYFPFAVIDSLRGPRLMHLPWFDGYSVNEPYTTTLPYVFPSHKLPKRVANDQSGDFYAVDPAASVIHKFDYLLNYLASYGGLGTGQTKFYWPSQFRNYISNSSAIVLNLLGLEFYNTSSGGKRFLPGTDILNLKVAYNYNGTAVVFSFVLAGESDSTRALVKRSSDNAVIANLTDQFFSFSGPKTINWTTGGVTGNYYLELYARAYLANNVTKRFDFTLGNGAPVTINSQVSARWNMLSVPNVVLSFAKTNVWPTSQADASWYQPGVGYVAKDPLENRLGYWIKFPPSPPNQTVTYVGSPLDSLHINVIAGWNMIGSISTDIYKTKIDTQGTKIISSIFGYRNGYITSDTIKAGNGYWVKVDRNGKIILNKNGTGGGFANCTEMPPPEPDPISLYLPTNNATGQSINPTLTWYSDANAVTYHLQVSQYPCLTTLIVNDSTIPQTANPTISKQIGTLAYSTSYYWRVRSKRSGANSGWSETRRFVTQDPPPGGDPCDPSPLSSMDRFTVGDRDGNQQEMFIYNKSRTPNVGFEDFELPPAPPQRLFDARFRSGKFIEGVPPGRGLVNIPIDIRNSVFPLTFHWNIQPNNGVRYWIVQPGGRTEIQGVGSTTMQELRDGVIVLQSTARPCDFVKENTKDNSIVKTGPVPEDFALQQNFPNPFNPKTVFRYQLPIGTNVTLRIYNMLGQEIATLLNEFQGPGYKSIAWDASEIPSGVYFYRFIAGSFTDAKKIIIIK